MINRISAPVVEYLRNRSGASAIEYSLIAAGISLAIMVTLFLFGDQIAATFTHIGASVSSISARATAEVGG